MTHNLTLILDDLAHQTNWPPRGQNCPKKISWKSDLGRPRPFGSVGGGVKFFRKKSKFYESGWDPLKVKWFDEQRHLMGLSNFRTPYWICLRPYPEKIIIKAGLVQLMGVSDHQFEFVTIVLYFSYRLYKQFVVELKIQNNKNSYFWSIPINLL